MRSMDSAPRRRRWASTKCSPHRGAPKAITAMAHKLARLVYRMLKWGHEYTRQRPPVLPRAPPRTTSATAQKTSGQAGAANRRTRRCLTSFERVSGEVDAGVISGWFFVGLAASESLLLPGIRPQIVHGLFTAVISARQLKESKSVPNRPMHRSWSQTVTYARVRHRLERQ